MVYTTALWNLGWFLDMAPEILHLCDTLRLARMSCAARKQQHSMMLGLKIILDNTVDISRWWYIAPCTRLFRASAAVRFLPMLSCHGSRLWKSSSSTPLGKDFLSNDIWPKSEVISFSTYEGWVSPVFSQNPEQGILPRFFQHGTKNPKTSKLDGICKPLWTWPASNQSPLSPWKIMESPLRTTQLCNSSRFINAEKSS